MKKILALVLGLTFVTSVAMADGVDKKIELGINGGVAVPTNTGFDLGFGGDVTGLYRVSENLGLGADIGFDTFSLTGLSGYSTSDLSILAELKYGFGTDKTKPYILVDAGLSIYSLTVSVLGISVSGSTSYPEIGGGLGIQFPAGDALNLFAQAKAQVVLATGSSFTYIPVDVGLNFDL